MISQINYRSAQTKSRIYYLSNKKIFPYFIYKQNFGELQTKYLWEVRSNRIQWLQRCKEIVENEFYSLIQEYKIKDSVVDIRANDSRNVWCAWFQGEEDMPDVVRKCIISQKENIPSGISYTLLTLKTIDDYIEIPGYIIDKVRKGTLTFTHLSDIIRFKALYEYGGIWLDSTVYVTNHISEDYFNLPIYSIQEKKNEGISDDAFYDILCSFVIGGAPKSVLFEFCYELMMEYQRRHNWLIDEHLINICYAIAYTMFRKTRTTIDMIGRNNPDRQLLNDIANDLYDEKKCCTLLNKQVFHKLNWRRKYIEKKRLKSTNYGVVVAHNSPE